MSPLTIFAPFALPYALALRVKNHGYAQGWLKQQLLKHLVVSIGNLSVGGAGKTPFVIALAQLLAQQGFHPDILSRGYGRVSRKLVERVDPAGDATRFGDEPLLIANATSMPVYVGASRYAAGLLSEQTTPAAATIHLLDDGFQHRTLARSADIVLLHPSDVAGRLLPAGRLREPLHSLHRADFLVLREDDATTEPALRHAGIHKPVWRVRRSLVPLSACTGKAFAFCGIAHPAEFFAALRSQNILLDRTLAFRDHHRFTPADLSAIAGQADGCDVIFTTEKDFIRLTPAQKTQLARIAPVHPVPLRVEILDADRCLAALLTLLSERNPVASHSA